MRRAGSLVVFLICACAVISRPNYAQVPKTRPEKPGALDGIVVNAKGAHVSGAQIWWQPSDGGTPHALHTDAQGHFTIPRLRSGLYDLRASRGQIQSSWTHNVLVRPGEPTTVTLRLVSTVPAKPALAN
jgi:hypothetical protein